MASDAVQERAPRARTADEFFEQVSARRQPLLGRTAGSLRFDVVDGDAVTPWHVAIDRGEVAVSHDQTAADVVVTIHRPLFEDVTCGRADMVSAALRGEIAIDGSPQLLNIFQRLFPTPTSPSAS
jgi:hypothetical protein